MFIFLTGWPACGASFYGDWLAERFDFRHFDAEDSASPARLQTAWEQLTPSRAKSFADALREQHPRWVVSAAAPTGNLRRLEALRAAGFSLWFLLPHTESLSRQRWLVLEREYDPETRPTAWEKQADAIRGKARELRPFFRDCCIETLNAGLELLDADALAARIGATGAEQAGERTG